MTVKIWESVTWCLENSSYCYVDVETGRRVDKRTKKFLDVVLEYTTEDAELQFSEHEDASEGVAQVFFRDARIDIPTLQKAKRATLLDTSTASIMNQVFNAVNDQNKENLRNRPFEKAALICWKLASK